MLPTYIGGMSSGYQTLTEKEKQTLRLLVAGHDAKSIARNLDLSVHTINERLREARRKMGTASSREAARMLRETEGPSPDSLGDKSFGDGIDIERRHGRSQPAVASKPTLRRGWIIGAIVMTISLALLALSSLSGAGAPDNPAASASASTQAPAPVAPTPASEAAAIASAKAFLALIDRDDWSASWDATHKSFQLLNTRDWWAQASMKVRKRIGAVQSREFQSVDFTAAPPAGYWIVSFRSRYALDPSVIETVHLAYEDGTWKVSSIMVE